MSCQMHCNRLRLALGAALVAFVLSTPALGAFYNPHFDPEFDGLVTFQIEMGIVESAQIGRAHV